MLSFKSILNVFTPKPVAQPQIIRLYNWLPLPCPKHACSLIPEERANGAYEFVCPVCRASNQPVDKPIQATPKPAQRVVRAGGAMHADRAKKRVETKLGQPITWSPPARPTRQLVPNTQAIYASAPTVMDIEAALHHD